MASETIGCRLLTVDAYKPSVPFYQHLGFEKNKEYRWPDDSKLSMRFDLLAPNLPAWAQ